MSDHTRRTFLVGAGAAAAAATAAAVVPGGAAVAASGTDPAPDTAGEASTDTLVAYVKDAKTGDISVMAGDREVVVTDRRLAQKLARLAD